MITLTKSGNAIVFTFDDNDHYLNDGKIEVPVNSLTLVTDDSQMATFRKSASNDIFISATYDELGMSKADLETFYKENMVGSTGGSVTPEEVQDMIDESISGKADTSDVQEIASDVTTVSGDVNTLSGSVNALTGAVNTLSGDVQTLSGDVANKADTTAVTASIGAAVSGKMDTSAFNTYSASTDARLAEDEEVTAAGLNALNNALDDKADTTAVTESINAAVSGKADTSAVTASITAAVSGKQDTLIAGTNITISGNVISAAGGNNVIELTQAQYDALTDVDPDAFYIITDADGGATTGQVQTMINTAIATKQDTLVSGTNIKTINNESLLGSGNIDIQTGSSINVVQATGTSTGDVMSQNAVTSNMALKSEAVGNYQFGETSGVEYLRFKKVSSGNIGSPIYYPKINNKGILTNSVTHAQNNYNFQLVETSAYTAYTASTDARLAEDEEVTAAGLNALNDALSGKQDTLSAGTNITISGNVISAEGGGATYTAGRGIDIDSGNTISFSLPISAGTGQYSVIEGQGTSAMTSCDHAEGKDTYAKGGSGYPAHAEGERTSAMTYSAHAEGRLTKANGECSHAEGKGTETSGEAAHAEGGWTKAVGNFSHAEGNSTSAMTYTSHAEGNSTIAKNESEHASGKHNVSNTGSTSSGNTLFSVGNGYSTAHTHNAIEIRQNGDFYFADTDNTTYQNDYEKPMVRLQDVYGALGGLKLVQISQSDYDNLQNKDASTLYIIT